MMKVLQKMLFWEASCLLSVYLEVKELFVSESISAYSFIINNYLWRRAKEYRGPLLRGFRNPKYEIFFLKVGDELILDYDKFKNYKHLFGNKLDDNLSDIKWIIENQ